MSLLALCVEWCVAGVGSVLCVHMMLCARRMLLAWCRCYSARVGRELGVWTLALWMCLCIRAAWVGLCGGMFVACVVAELWVCVGGAVWLGVSRL